MSELHSGFGSHCRCAEGEVERLRSAILTLHSRSNEEGEVVIPLTGEGDIAQLLALHSELEAMRPRVDKLGADPDHAL